MRPDPKKIVSTPAMMIFLTGLALFAYLGIFNRYWSDDWCINADFRELGFVGTLKGYSYITTYSSNRFSLIFFSGILNFLDILGVQIMSPINILLLAIGLYWCAINIQTMTNASATKTLILSLVLLTTYYSIYLAPHLYQSLYWRSASLPYFSPLAMGALIFALITHQGVRAKPSVLLNVSITILAFLAGGFSEAGSATLTTCAVLYIGLAWFFRQHRWAKQSLPGAVAALAGLLISMAVLISSPTTQYRVGLYGEPARLIDLPLLVWRFSSDFVKFSLKDLPLPHLVITVTSFLLGYLPGGQRDQPLQTRKILLVVAIAAAIAFIIIAASFAPSAYIEKAPPHPRTRIIPRFILTLALVFVSYMAGLYAGQIQKPGRFYLAAMLIFIAACLYSVRSIAIVSQNIPIYAERAQIWDERDRQIERAVANGENEIYVQAIDGLPVGGIRDFDVKGQGKIGYWINRCAARYYGIGSIDILPP